MRPYEMTRVNPEEPDRDAPANGGDTENGERNTNWCMPYCATR